jgi:SAM-dependent methyltransferase
MKPVTTEDVLGLMDAHLTAAALGAALELGLFWLLAERPLDAAGVAQELGIPVNRCQYWLQLLGSAGLLEQVSGAFAPSATAQAAILDVYRQESWAFLAGEARQQFPALHDLPQRMPQRGSTWAAQGLRPPNYFNQIVSDPQRARTFTRMLYEIHRPLADELAAHLDLSALKRVLDLGGGSGVVSLALLRRYPQLVAVVLDIANVCVAGREIAQENALEGRISYQAADFLCDELPLGFDAVLECDVGVYSKALFRKIRASLNPGGRLLIVDQFAPAEGVAPQSRLHWAFQASLHDPDFNYLTAAAIESKLAQASFQSVSVSALPQADSSRWAGDWVVIEARR